MIVRGRPAVNPRHVDPERRSMPVAEWPEADREAWQAALTPGDLLDEGGIRARYAPETNRKLAKNYGSWLTRLSRRDCLTTRRPRSA
jgi:hypothetical protein